MAVTSVGIVIFFRPQRSSLAESMTEVREFADYTEMADTLERECEETLNCPCNLITTITPFNDDRIGWGDSRYVLISIQDEPTYRPIGVCCTKVSVVS